MGVGSASASQTSDSKLPDMENEIRWARVKFGSEHMLLFVMNGVNGENFIWFNMLGNVTQAG